MNVDFSFLFLRKCERKNIGRSIKNRPQHGFSLANSSTTTSMMLTSPIQHNQKIHTAKKCLRSYDSVLPVLLCQFTHRWTHRSRMFVKFRSLHEFKSLFRIHVALAVVVTCIASVAAVAFLVFACLFIILYVSLLFCLFLCNFFSLYSISFYVWQVMETKKKVYAIAPLTTFIFKVVILAPISSHFEEKTVREKQNSIQIVCVVYIWMHWLENSEFWCYRVCQQCSSCQSVQFGTLFHEFWFILVEPFLLPLSN